MDEIKKQEQTTDRTKPIDVEIELIDPFANCVTIFDYIEALFK